MTLGLSWFRVAATSSVPSTTGTTVPVTRYLLALRSTSSAFAPTLYPTSPVNSSCCCRVRHFVSSCSSNTNSRLVVPKNWNRPVIFTGTATVRRNMSTLDTKFHCVHVFIKIKPGTEQAFVEATMKNARHSALEPGVVRFDVLQDQDDPNAFVLVEVYTDSDKAPLAHKETAHYLEWRDTVADMMAEPRQARKFHNLFPTNWLGWKYPDPKALE